MESLGKRIRNLRENSGLLLRQVAASIQIDQALLSKIERGERTATRSQVIALAKLFELDETKFLSLWLGEKIAHEIKNEEFANEALQVAEMAIIYLKQSEREVSHV
jgi:HTH-type transcriptional regulator, competence development regulator